MYATLLRQGYILDSTRSGTLCLTRLVLFVPPRIFMHIISFLCVSCTNDDGEESKRRERGRDKIAIIGWNGKHIWSYLIRTSGRIFSHVTRLQFKAVWAIVFFMKVAFHCPLEADLPLPTDLPNWIHASSHRGWKCLPVTVWVGGTGLAIARPKEKAADDGVMSGMALLVMVGIGELRLGLRGTLLFFFFFFLAGIFLFGIFLFFKTLH